MNYWQEKRAKERGGWRNTIRLNARAFCERVCWRLCGNQTIFGLGKIVLPLLDTKREFL